MDNKQKAIFVGLWCVLFFEMLGILILIYYARLPYFLSLFASFLRLLLPWAILINLTFLVFILCTRGVEFTWVFWLDYIKELFKFFISSFVITLLVIAISSLVGVALGFSAEYISRLSFLKAIHGWGFRHSY